jgi:hypothetical protein
MSEEQDPISPEYQAFLDDLKQYDNPEVFEDASLPQIYKFSISLFALANTPYILKVELNGDVLPSLLAEATLEMLRQDPRLEEQSLEELYNAASWEELREKILADKEYLDVEIEMRRFFVRHLPKLIFQIYKIALSMSILHPIKNALAQPEDKGGFEKLLKLGLNAMLRNLEKDIKRMLDTRPRGRPKKFEKGNLPEIVIRVLDKAEEMMGEGKGIDAVPGLKQVADELGFSENALGKQLVRAGYRWTVIRDYLARQP